MSVGLPSDKNSIDSRAGSLAIALRDIFTQISRFEAWLAAQTDQSLINLGYTSTEVAQLKSAFTDLDQLRQVYEGTATRSPAYDYRTFAGLLVGVS